MIKGVLKVFSSFGKRMQKDHLGAYAATCAYFLMISFVPFLMILIAIASRTGADVSVLTNGIVDMVPSGLKDYIITIIGEVSKKAYEFLPISVLILLWSAAKFFHALTNGLNVISSVEESRGWFFLRFRSMFFVVSLMGILALGLYLTIFGNSISASIRTSFPGVGYTMDFLYSTRSLYGYFALIAVFLWMYKILPNCYYTFRSQLPGALIVSTVWMFFSYLMTLYYTNNVNFSKIYGSLTGIVLAMIWLYFCCFFLLFGAELNRVIVEDPEDNVIVSTIDAVRDANVKKKQQIMEELDEHSVWKPIPEDDDAKLTSLQPKDIVIPWADEIGNDSNK